MKPIIDFIVGVSLIILGALFLAFLPIGGSYVATDAIFVGAGVLIIRRGYQNARRTRNQSASKNKKNKNQQQPSQVTKNRQKQRHGQKSKNHNEKP